MSKHRFYDKPVLRIKFPHAHFCPASYKETILTIPSKFQNVSWFLSPDNQPSCKGKQEGWSSLSGVPSSLRSSLLFCSVVGPFISNPAEFLLVSSCPELAFTVCLSYQLLPITPRIIPTLNRGQEHLVQLYKNNPNKDLRFCNSYQVSQYL